jgi:hypothetical protein
MENEMSKRISNLKYLIIMFVLGSSLVLPGCSSLAGSGTETILGLGLLAWQLGVFDKDGGDKNDPPQILTLTAVPNSITLGGSVLLTVVAYDPDSSDTLLFAWTCGDGSLSSPTESVTTWTAPTDNTGTYYINITVSDGKDSVTSQIPVIITLT